MEYVGVLDGNFNANDVPAPMNLKLKQGALVMFVKNGVHKIPADRSVTVLDQPEEPCLLRITGGREALFPVSE